MKRILTAFISLLLLSIPSLSFAVDGTELIPSMADPAQSSSYQFTSPVVLNGTWQLPPKWAGFIEVYMDAVIDSQRNPLTMGILKTDINTGKTGYFIDNSTGLSTTTGTFSINIGTQPNGDHNLYIKFWGGTECAVNRALNEINANGITNRTPDCGKNGDNFRPNLVWPAREFSVSLPDWPRMEITPSSTPALNFSNVVLGSMPTQTFTIANTGNQTLTGSLSLPAPFSCASCSYTINPGGSKVVTVTFAPTTSPTSFVGNANFSCVGTSLGCDGAPWVITSRNFQVIGNSVNNAIPPTLSINPSPIINYGLVNVGSVNDRTIRVTNTGGGLLNGAIINFSTPEYTCPLNPTCQYSLFAGQFVDILVRYIPTLVGPHVGDTANFSGGSGGVITFQSVVNDQPIVTLSYVPTIPFGTKINVGKCVQKLEFVQNSGAGLLSGSVQGIPIALAPDEVPGFSCVDGCVYTNLAHGVDQQVTFQFCPWDDSVQSVLVPFSNTSNPPGSASVTLTGQGNILPIGNLSGIVINFPSTLINTPITRTLTVTNTGVGVLSGTVSPATSYPSIYTCLHTDAVGSTDCSYNIPQGGNMVFTFQFLPSAVQSYNGATMAVPGAGTITLNGSGIQPRFQMSYIGYPDSPFTPASSVLPPSPKSYNIGSTIFGGSASVLNKKFYLFIKNTGSGAPVNYAFHNAPHYVCLGGTTYLCSGSLPPGAKDIIVYEFQPDAPTTFPESIIVDYNYGDGNFPTLQLDVTGDSVSAPYLSVSPNTLINLGNISVGATTSAVFTVSNLGIGPLSGTVTFPSLSTAVDPMSGLLYRWTFDNADINWTTHSVTDVAGNGNTGTISGPVSAVGKYGEALKFIRQGGVSLNHLTGFALGNTPHTTMMWIKPTDFPNMAWFAQLGQWGSYSEHWFQWANGTTQFGVWGGNQVQPTIPLGKWTHVALVFDGTNLKSYVDGVIGQTTPATYGFTNDAFNLGNGKLIYGGNGGTDFEGLLDDVRVYNRPLSATEIVQVASNTAPVASGLLVKWTFDDPTVVWSQMKVMDMSGKGNDGSLSSVPSTVAGKLGQALSFNGMYDNEVTTLTATNNPVNFSIGAWFKTTSASGKKIIGFEDKRRDLSGNYDRHLYMGDDGKIYFGVHPGYTVTIPSLSALNDGIWHYALGTHDASGNTVLYIDGVSQGALNSGVQNYAGYWRIGGYRVTGWTHASDGYFAGAIDDARVYNRALTASEATDLYQAGVSGGVSAFTCVQGCTFGPLLNNQSDTVKVEFSPTEAIGYIGYPLFASIGLGGNVGYPAVPYPSLTGTGVLDPMIDASPVTLSFPVTNLGLSTKINLIITNTGLGDLIGNVSPVKSSGIEFYCLSNCNYNLASGATTSAVIEFSPIATSSRSGFINLTSNAINTPALSIPAFGTGKFAPIIDLRGGDTNYGKVVIGKHKSQTFIIDNSNSTADLGTGTFVVTGPYKCTASDDGFDVSGDCRYNLPAGGSAVITVMFSPVSVGGLPATSINTGSVWLSGIPLARFFVQGIGVAPSVKFIED